MLEAHDRHDPDTGPFEFLDRRGFALAAFLAIERDRDRVARAPAASSSAIASRIAVPAVITSSMIITRPLISAPTVVPPSPWSLASLRLNA